VLALRGKPAGLRQFADGVLGLKGVLHGQLVVSSPGLAAHRPTGGGEAQNHSHPHAHPHLHPHADGDPPSRRRKGKP